VVLGQLAASVTEEVAWVEEEEAEGEEVVVVVALYAAQQVEGCLGPQGKSIGIGGTKVKSVVASSISSLALMSFSG